MHIISNTVRYTYKVVKRVNLCYVGFFASPPPKRNTFLTPTIEKSQKFLNVEVGRALFTQTSCEHPLWRLRGWLANHVCESRNNLPCLPNTRSGSCPALSYSRKECKACLLSATTYLHGSLYFYSFSHFFCISASQSGNISGVKRHKEQIVSTDGLV